MAPGPGGRHAAPRSAARTRGRRRLRAASAGRHALPGAPVRGHGRLRGRGAVALLGGALGAAVAGVAIGVVGAPDSPAAVPSALPASTAATGTARWSGEPDTSLATPPVPLMRVERRLLMRRAEPGRVRRVSRSAARPVATSPARRAPARWQSPVARGAYHLTARFGECSSLWSSCHTGLDFAAPTGTAVHSVTDGVVREVGWAGAYGYRTVVRAGDGTELWYCHQTSIGVGQGQRVTAGQVIGTVGSTGNTTGPHLHLEVRPRGGDPVDPFAALTAHGVRP